MTGPVPPTGGTIGDLLERCTFPAPGTAVMCAVSGGPDSTALLVLATAAGLDVTAIHVEHGLRAGSAAEADVVAATAARFGARFVSERVVVGDGPNLEARARDARAAVLPPDVLTGHTLDDQAETVLLFLVRGVGPSGLAGIDPARRPLLSLRRAETVALCRELEVAVVTDPSNDDPRFVRNRLRAEALPLLAEIAGRDVAPLLARTAALQREVLEVVAGAAALLDATDAASLAAALPAVASEAVRAWWRAGSGEHYAPDAAAVDRIMGVARGEAVATDVVAGWRVERTAGRLRLVPPLGAPGEAR